MIYETTALMTFADILIIGVIVYAFWVFQKHKKSVHVKELCADFFLIAAGLGVVGLYYLCDLVFMQIIPLMVPPGELVDGLNRAHFYIMCVAIPAGVSLVAIGFARSILRASKVIAELWQSEKHAQQMGLETVTALSKLNQREAELTEQNERFHAALENMSQGLCMFDSEQRLIMSNGLYASIYGLSKELVVPGTTFRQILEHRISHDVFAGEDSEKYIEERLSAVCEDKGSTKIQLISDGRVFAIAHRPLADGGWVATHEDITELAKAEAMNQRLASIVEDAINEIYVFDAETLKFIEVNASGCRNLGYTMEEMRKLTPLDIKPEYTRELFEDHISPLRNGEKTHIQFDTVHRRKDGSLYNAKITLQQIRSQNQQVFAAIIEDVTDRNHVERKLKESEEMFSKAFHANNVPFSISGSDGNIFDVNEAWLTALGYRHEEVIGKSALKLGIWADPGERACFVEMLKRDGAVNNFETHYRSKTGQLRDMVVSGEWVEVHGQPRMFNISHDVTESKATERQLVEHRDHLQELVNEATSDLKAKAQELKTSLAKEKELNEVQRQFISVASHEFRTPLAIIDSTAQRLIRSADRLSTEDTLKRVNKIRNAVVRMTRLMESTLTAARLDEGKISVDMRSCNVRKIISDVCLRLQDISSDHVISCKMGGLPETICADACALDQVLTNLLSNAVKYAPGEPDIQVEAYSDGNQVVIQVRDHGLGIDEDDLPKMFERFFRAKTSNGIAGTGIGLNLVKTLVEMHDGSISIQSKQGKGSTFTVRLPVAGPSRAEKAA